MALHSVIEQGVTSLGYELVDIEHGPGGVLRVFIDVVPGGPTEFIRIEDCERVSHQLSHLLTVESIDYARLEISSPGVDRPLKKPADFERFQGCEATVRLRRPLQGRRNFEGVLTVEPDGRFGLVLSDSAGASPARSSGGRRTRPSAAKARATDGPAETSQSPQSHGGKDGESGMAGESVGRKLVFALDEIDRARLVPALKF
jgi:ribosome maturation factor RimP